MPDTITRAARRAGTQAEVRRLVRTGNALVGEITVEAAFVLALIRVEEIVEQSVERGAERPSTYPNGEQNGEQIL